MRILKLTIQLAATAAALVAIPAAAQPTANRPWSADGRLEDSDSQAEERRYDEHRVRLEAGRRYRLTANSEDFDPVLRLYAPGGTEPIAENDDSGSSLNSRIIHVPERAGSYTLRVQAFANDGRGAYTLGAEVLPPLPPAATLQLAPRTMTWTSIAGELGEDDAMIGDTRADDYSVFLAAGEEVIVRLDGEFDTVVSIYRASDRDGDPLETDDDGGDGLNSMLLFRATETGEHIIRVTALGEGAGAYRLRIGQ